MSTYEPDEALVEVAARAMFAFEQCDQRQCKDIEGNWTGRLNDADRAEYRDLADAVLRAVGPTLLARGLADYLDTLGVDANEDHDGEYWDGYRQAQRETWGSLRRYIDKEAS